SRWRAATTLGTAAIRFRVRRTLALLLYRVGQDNLGAVLKTVAAVGHDPIADRKTFFDRHALTTGRTELDRTDGNRRSFVPITTGPRATFTALPAGTEQAIHFGQRPLPPRLALTRTFLSVLVH